MNTAQAPKDGLHVVILIHGIRDYALWQANIRAELSSLFTVESTNYGRFDLIRFILPVKHFRNRAIQTVWKQIRDIRRQYPTARYSFVAHSFGTYVLAHIIANEFDFVAERLVFCGSVLPYDFPFEQFAERFKTPILNEVGTRDIWPALAESVTWGYGSAGTYGFRRPRVHDRWHAGARHGYFLNREFCRRYWVPFLTAGEIEGTADTPQPPQLWVRVISILHMKYLSLLLLAALAVFGAQIRGFVATPPDPIGATGAELPTLVEDETVQVAREILELAYQGEPLELYERFSPAARRGYTFAQYRSSMKRVMAQLHQVPLRRELADTSEIGGFLIVSFDAEFDEVSRWKEVVTFSKAGTNWEPYAFDFQPSSWPAAGAVQTLAEYPTAAAVATAAFEDSSLRPVLLGKWIPVSGWRVVVESPGDHFGEVTCDLKMHEASTNQSLLAKEVLGGCDEEQNRILRIWGKLTGIDSTSLVVSQVRYYAD